LKIVIGVGNPGARYEVTRHNCGFLAVDHIAHSHDIEVNLKSFDSLFGKGRIGAVPVLLVKPATFMNRSGSAVKQFADYFRIEPSDIIVIHDDIDLPFKTVRLKSGGGHAGHKGLISIVESLDSTEFLRVRIGIGRPPDELTVERYVLDQFSDDETKLLPHILKTADHAVETIITSGIQAAMNQYNERARPEDNESGAPAG